MPGSQLVPLHFFDRERSAYLEGIVEPACHFAQREPVGHGYLSSTHEALFSVFECETIYLPASRVRSVEHPNRNVVQSGSL